MSKNSTMLAAFTAYCRQHPEERFWQALRNWTEFSFIFSARVAKEGEDYDFILLGTPLKVYDTFYKEKLEHDG